MADAMPIPGLLDGEKLAQGPDTDASFRVQPRAAQFVFRGAAQAAQWAGEAFGVDLPTEMCRAAQAGPRAALWQGPDEWLLIAPADDEDAVAAAMRAALAEVPHALVGVGHRNVALEVAGPRATDVLNAGCPLDLDLSAFPVGMCTRTVLARAPILLWRTGDTAFTLGAWRSFVPYVWDFLIEARTRL